MMETTKSLDSGDTPAHRPEAGGAHTRAAGTSETLAWDSHDLPPGVDGPAAWAAALSSLALPVTLVSAERQGFHGRFSARQFGPTAIFEISAAAQRIQRGAEEIAAGPRDLFFVSVMTRNTGWLLTQDSRIEVPEGHVSFVSAATPFKLHFETAFAYISAVIPADDLLALLPRATLAHGVVIAPPAGPALAAFLQSLLSTDAHPADENRLYTHFVGMAAAAIDPVAAARAGAAPSRDEILLSRIKAYLAGRLADGRVSSAGIAAQHGMGVRKLQRLFRAEGVTLAGWMMEERLRRCQRDLLDPRCAGRTITDIATGWGVSDMGQFARVFKARYGLPPAAFRRRGALTSSMEEAAE